MELARNFNADLLDYAAARKKRVPNGRGSREVGGPIWFSPMLAGRKVQAIFTDGEQIGLPLAAPFDNRACHLELKKAVFVDWLGVQSAIDRFVTYSRWQQRSIEDRWKLSRNRGL